MLNRLRNIRLAPQEPSIAGFGGAMLCGVFALVFIVPNENDTVSEHDRAILASGSAFLTTLLLEPFIRAVGNRIRR